MKITNFTAISREYQGGFFMTELKTLDEILWQRQSIRQFDERALEKEMIEKIIEAGRLAPFAGLVQKNTDSFRHFFVIHRDSETAQKVKRLVEEGRRAEAVRIHETHLDERYPEVAAMMKHISTKPADDIFLSPWLIIIAERAGLPQREEICLGYVLENMWLKATEAGVALKICSGISDIHDRESLKNLLGLDAETDYAFDACSVGYPKYPVQEKREHPKPVRSVKYFV